MEEPTLAKPINCNIPDEIFKKILTRKSQMQKKTTDNVTFTDAVVAVLEDGFRY